MTEKLQQFDKRPICPKCESRTLSKKYWKESQDKFTLEIEPAYIRVTCDECGYSWKMECADADN